MIAKFYNNKAPNNKVDKTPDITQVGGDTELTLYLPTSTSNPIFKVHADGVQAPLVHNGAIGNTVNYLKADNTLGNRYYFVNDVVHDKGFKLIYCTVDPLMSYREDILNSEQFVTRNEFKYNEYYVDEIRPLQNKRQIIVKSFGGTLWDSGLGEPGNSTYILGVIGGGA